MPLPYHCFYFVAQTGCIYFVEPIAPSNFYMYTLTRHCLARIKLEVAKAPCDNSGLVYPIEFLEWLDKNDIKGKI